MRSKLTYYYEMYRRLNLLNSMPKIVNYLKYRSLPRQEKMSVRRYTPQVAQIYVTLRCNLNCSYCSAGRILHRKEEEWRKREATLEKVKKIFNNPLFANCIMIDLQGGEPLLVKELGQIISFLTKRGHVVNFSTNGLLLYNRIHEMKDAGVSRINVSIYDTNRPILKRVLPKINKIFPVHTSLVLLRGDVENNQDKLLATVRFARDAGCRSLRFWIYRPVDLHPKPNETITASLPAYIKFRQRVEKAVPGFCLWPSTVQTANRKKRCPQLWQRVGCDMLGNMAICCGTEKMLTGPNSNLFNCDPDVLLNHPLLVTMRKQLLDPVNEPPEICKSCNLLGESGW